MLPALLTRCGVWAAAAAAGANSYIDAASEQQRDWAHALGTLPDVILGNLRDIDLATLVF
jgi:hypothetical protein